MVESQQMEQDSNNTSTTTLRKPNSNASFLSSSSSKPDLDSYCTVRDVQIHLETWTMTVALQGGEVLLFVFSGGSGTQASVELQPQPRAQQQHQQQQKQQQEQQQHQQQQKQHDQTVPPVLSKHRGAADRANEGTTAVGGEQDQAKPEPKRETQGKKNRSRPVDLQVQTRDLSVPQGEDKDGSCLSAPPPLSPAAKKYKARLGDRKGSMPNIGATADLERLVGASVSPLVTAEASSVSSQAVAHSYRWYVCVC